MAQALAHFNLLNDSSATRSKLPATAFAKYVVAKDALAQEQWKKDNNLEQKTTDSMVVEPSVTTDQEWCHLFGHGDGGSEELGNFVSGSKHCNTEQLAIEIGQRRISYYQDSKGDKVNLTAKITAYLMPNQGAWKEVKLSKIVKLFGDNQTSEEIIQLLNLDESNIEQEDKIEEENKKVLKI